MVTREEIKRRLTISANLIWSLLQTEVGQRYIDEEMIKEEVDAFEKMIGNEIFYKSNTLIFWTGMMSEGLIRECLTKKTKECRDHQYPRKLAIKEIVEMDFNHSDDPADDIAEAILTKFGTWNLVTTKENSFLRPFQLANTFVTPEQSYQSANVKLVEVTNHEKNRIFAGDKLVITEVLERNP